MYRCKVCRMLVRGDWDHDPSRHELYAELLGYQDTDPLDEDL